MRCNAFDDHITAEDDIIESHRNVTGTMPRQMDYFKWTDAHVHGFVGKVNGNGMVEGFGRTINVEELITRLFSETSFGEEGSEAATDECESRFMICDCLQIQFMTSDLCTSQQF